MEQLQPLSMEGPLQHPGPQNPVPSTEELIPTLSSALEHLEHTDPKQPSLRQQGACYPKEPAPVRVQATWVQKCWQQAQRAEGNNPGRRRGTALDSRDSRGCAVLAEGMAKESSPCQRQGEWKVSRGQELAGI